MFMVYYTFKILDLIQILMKTIITTLAILMGIITTGPSDKQFDFNKAWAQVEKFISEGLPQSALEKVEEIHNQAIVEKKIT